MHQFDLDRPLLQIPLGQQNYAQFTIRHAVEGIQIFGGIGSGKTSGSGKMLAQKFLENQFGGLVLTAKQDEKDLWVDYCRKAGRLDDLIIIEPGGKYRFNFLQYISKQSETNEAITENIVEVLKTVIQAGEEKEKGSGDDAFWTSALDMMLLNIVDLCQLAYGEVTLETMYNILQTLPKPAAAPAKEKTDEEKEKEAKKQPTAYEIADAIIKEKHQADYKDWLNGLSPEYRRSLNTKAKMEQAVMNNLPNARLTKYLLQFFHKTYKTLSSKTQSIIEFIFAGFVYRLLREPVFTLFCNEPSNISPEDCSNGKIILINLPVKKYHKVGRDCQIMFKYIWQRSMEKRIVNDTTRPVFLFADEAQNFIHEHDAVYQATARSSKIATLYITQNLPNYYSMMGGNKAEYKVKSFMGTLATKIFHANADIETNIYASNLFGEADHTDPQLSVSVGKDSLSQTHSMGLSLQKLVRPEQFTALKTGGPLNNHKVEGYLHRQGDALFGARSFKKIIFNQL
ncbi:type IV secretory system conjugative DNA transfer family protein [Mucilaginibacter terrae]|uniref:type IV secretory system conjugative DNA transfer family protein n=1 Tax=Mucilaginibacter terrae TaxID=1955052 RepID=UPI00363B3AA7